MKKKIIIQADRSPIDLPVSQIPSEEPEKIAPITRRLSGMLSKNLALQDYRNHLVEKYGQSVSHDFKWEDSDKNQ